MGEEQRLSADEMITLAREQFDGGKDFTLAVEEEFALILSAETTKAEAREICERLRLKVQNLAIVVPGMDGRESAVRVTLSLGGAMFPADVPVTWDRSRGLDRPGREKLAHELWTRANMNLRASKERGKNQATLGGET